MSTPAQSPIQFEGSESLRRQALYSALLVLSVVSVFLIWPNLLSRLLASNYLPHLYCYLGKPALVWTHVIADGIIALSYLTISLTLVYLVFRGRRELPFPSMFLAFGLFIIACGATHLMEIVTIWIPVYVLSAVVKVFTALASLVTAALLPLTVPQALSLIRAAKISDAAQEKFHQIADNIQEIFWMVDAHTLQAIYVNPAFEQITGRTVASLLEWPLSYREIIHPEDRANILRRLEEVAKTGALDEEFRIIRSDHTVRWVAARGFAVHDERGEVYRLAGVVQDITARRQAEQALRESEDRYRDLVEHSHDLLCTHDLEGRLLSCNEAPAQILGYEVAELLKIPMRELIAPEFRDQFDQYLARIKTNGADKGLMAVVRRNGERRVWEYSNTLRTEGVTSPIVRGMAHDITERKAAETALRRSEENYRMFVAQSSEGIFRQDLDEPIPIDLPEDELIQRILNHSYLAECNDAIAKMYGLNSAGDFVGKRLIETLDPCDPHNVELTREFVRSGFRVLERESHEVDIHGNRKVFLNSMIGIVEDGKLIRTWGIQRDATERKRTEEALRKSQAELARMSRIAALGELTASIAHDIRQPLTAVVTDASASLHWLASRPPNLDEAREATERVIREANRASAVIERMRALLKKSPSQRLPVDVNDVIREVLVIVGNELTRGEVTLQIAFDTDIPAVPGDRVQLQQVVLNLIMNAIDAMRDVNGRPRNLLISTKKDSEGVFVQVQDSGVGVIPEQEERIFEPFFTTKAEGIGMGLSIARSIVEDHGGRLWATRASSYGTVLEFTLPAGDGAT